MTNGEISINPLVSITVTTTVWKVSNGAVGGCVVVIFNRLAENSLSDVLPWTDRIITAYFSWS